MARSWWTWSATSPWRLLPDRTAETVAQWLRTPRGGSDHAGSVQCVCRGRTPRRPWRHAGGRPLSFVAEPRRSPHPGVHDAWPGARRRQCHGAPAARAPARWDERGPGAPTSHAPGRAGPGGPARRAPAGRYDAVWALHRQGWSTVAIAAQVGCSRRTIERYLQTADLARAAAPAPLWAEYPQSL